MAYQAKHAGLSVGAQLRLDIQEFSKNLAKASSMMTNFAKNSTKPLQDMDKKLHKIGLGLRDVARIASGIVISQMFYRGAQAIGDATDALTEFNEKLDYAHVTYTALFGSADLSSSFLETLKEQSIDTMFAFEDLTEASKKLLAYGIDYKNVGYITEGLGNLAAMSGDSAAMDRISYALGQIYAKGTIKAEEMRQLANAYVPIQQILKESFNLTDEQIGRVGDLRIPAEDAINAIVDYANTKFGSVGQAAMLTITGLKNRITDSFKVIGSEVTKPLTNAFKSFLAWFNGQLDNVREAYLTGGAGGIFEYLVPNEGTQQLLRQFFASLGNAVTAFIRLIVSVAPIVSTMSQAFITAFNILSPGIVTLGNILSALISIVANNRVAMNMLTGAIIAGAAAWVIYKARIISAAIIAGVTKGIYAIVRAVMVLSATLTKSPIVGVLGIVGIALLAIAASSEKARASMSKLFDRFQGVINGLKSDDILQVKDGMEQTSEASDEFNERLTGSGNALDELAEKAGDAKKGLLSFDEVFKLNDTNDETTTPSYDADGILDGLNVSGDSWLPDITDFSDYTDSLVDNLFGDLWESIKSIVSGAAGGALAGGLVGFAIGGLVTKSMAGAMEGAKWGSRIGAAVGGGFAAFWTDSYAQMEEAVNKITVTGGAGALIGGLAGMVIAAFATTGLAGKDRVNAIMTGGKLGTALGGLLGAGIGGFWALADGAFENSLSAIAAGGSAGALVGGLVGMVIAAFATSSLTGKDRLKAIMTGAGWGASLGSLIGGGLSGFWSTASDELKSSIEATFVGGATGALIGGLVGMVLGAFVTRSLSGALEGAKWGVAIGGAIGGVMGNTFDTMEETLKEKLSGLFASVGAASKGAVIGGLVGMLIGAVIGVFAGGIGAIPGAKLGGTIGAMAGGLIGAFVAKLQETDVPGKISEWISGIGEKLKNAAGAVKEWLIDDGNWKALALFFVNPIAGIGKLLYNNNDDFKNWVDDAWSKIKNAASDIKEWLIDDGNWKALALFFVNPFAGIAGLLYNNNDDFKNWVDGVKTDAAEMGSSIKTTVTDWADTTRSKVSTWSANTKQSISDWASETKAKYQTWSTNTKASISSWYADTKSKVTNWSSETKTRIQTWASETSTRFSTWTASTKSKFTNWYAETKSGMVTWVSNTKSSLKDWWNNIWDPSAWKSGWSRVKSWFSDLFADISSWFTNIGSSISTWWDNLWDGKSVSTKSNVTNGSFSLRGHATGGVFNREHVARFAEGNRAEAIIPLQNDSAMQPFVDAVSNGLLSSLMPMLATSGGYANDMPPMYVGTLIADDKGLKELERKLKVIRVKEEKRGN